LAPEELVLQLVSHRLAGQMAALVSSAQSLRLAAVAAVQTMDRMRPLLEMVDLVVVRRDIFKQLRLAVFSDKEIEVVQAAVNIFQVVAVVPGVLDRRTLQQVVSECKVA
jgi:hypothetical protein